MDKQTCKLLARIAENLPEMDKTTMQGWIDNPKTLRNVLKDALRPIMEQKVWPIWRTIKLGIGPKTADEFHQALKDAGYQIDNRCNDIFDRPAFSVSAEELEVDLIVASVAELGFKKGAKYSDICSRTKELGLELCSDEVGLQLCLQYNVQLNGECLFIAMESCFGLIGDRGGFLVNRNNDGSLWLYRSCGDPDYFWNADCRFVFLRRK